MAKREWEEARPYAEVAGEGTYNCAVVTHDGIIRRISAIDENEMDLWRASAMLKEFNAHQSKLGPSVLIALSDPEIVEYDEIEEWIEECEEMKDVDRYYTQYIEWGKGGALADYPALTKKLDVQFAFSLLWFFYVAQSLFGFRHRDLKSKNVVIREYPAPHTFSFALGEQRFEFVTTQVPVVIDLDFGSFFTTNAEDRNVVGTYAYAPPESLLEHILGVEHADNTGYDWFALGMVLLEMWLRATSFENIFAQRIPYTLVNEFYRKLVSRNVAAAGENYSCAQSVLYTCLWNYMLWGPVNLVPTQDNLFTFAPRIRRTRPFLEQKIIPRVSAMLDVLRSTLSEEQKTLLRTLLSWKPTDRHVDGEPWRLFQFPLFAPLRVAGEPHQGVTQHFAYGKHPILDNARATQLIEYMKGIPNLELCIGCGLAPAAAESGFCSALCKLNSFY